MRRACLLSLLSLALLACSESTAPAATGQWGGPVLGLRLDRAGGFVTLGCADGVIDSTWTLGRDGEFFGQGTLSYGGGPVPINGYRKRPADFRGRISARYFVLSITVTDSNVTIGPYLMERGRQMEGPVCLAANG